MTALTGAQVIARSLLNLGVTVIFGIVGIPVVEIAEESINLGIRFIGFRNEQAASYAAGAYGYLTGQPGVCLIVGGPGVLHAMPGIGNSSVNAFPLLVLAGSSESHLISRGAFQELDAIALLTPHTKLALRPPSLESVPHVIQNAYRSAWYGRPGTGFVDLPADLIQDSIEDAPILHDLRPVPECPKSGGDESRIDEIVQLLKTAKDPLVVIGKGAAYAKVEHSIRMLIENCRLPFLPTPMGKGVLPDSHPLNSASARSTALKEADVVLILGARLNWILHFGSPPKWNPRARFIQIDISAGEIGRNNTADASLSILGDLRLVVPQLLHALGSWSYKPSISPYTSHLASAKSANLKIASQKASSTSIPMTFARALSTIERTLHALSPPDEGGIVYVSEGANTMDISRSIFPVSHPRLRLDAGTHATMGVGLGYAIAAHVAYSSSPPSASSGPSTKKKKIVALEGDSAFGFSGMEIETMARYGMDILIFVLNNSGVYHGDTDERSSWTTLQQQNGLRSTSLGFETRYEEMAKMCGGVGICARTPEELETATRRGWSEERVVIVNVIIEAGNKGGKLEFGWQESGRKKGKEGPKL